MKAKPGEIRKLKVWIFTKPGFITPEEKEYVPSNYLSKDVRMERTRDVRLNGTLGCTPERQEMPSSEPLNLRRRKRKRKKKNRRRVQKSDC